MPLMTATPVSNDKPLPVVNPCYGKGNSPQLNYRHENAENYFLVVAYRPLIRGWLCR